MIIKFHPATHYDGSKFSSLKNIVLLGKKYDLNMIMPFTDVLITDYSTTLTDYMLLNKNMIVFIFDFESYISQCRDLLFPFEECIKGIPVAHNANELLLLMFKESVTLPNIPSELIERYWKPSRDIIEAIKDNINI